VSRRIVVLVSLAVVATIVLCVRPSIRHILTVARWSDTYRLDRTEALRQYRALIGSEYLPAIEAADYFSQHGAFEIGAAALPETRIRNVAAMIVFEILSRKERFSAASFRSAIRQLELENRDQTSDGGEHEAGVDNMKASLATTISRWLQLQDPALGRARRDTVAEYDRFIVAAKQKAATEKTNSPF
jgi:hypothetical protein